MKKLLIMLILVVGISGCFSKEDEKVNLTIRKNGYDEVKNIQIDGTIIGSYGDLKVKVKKGEHRVVWVEYTKNNYGEVYSEWYDSDVINISRDNQIFVIDDYNGIYEITE